MRGGGALLAAVLLLARATPHDAARPLPDEQRLPGWLGETHRVDVASAKKLRGGGGVARDDASASSDASFFSASNVTTLSASSPRAYVYRGFLTDAECDHFIARASPKLAKSNVVDTDTGEGVPSAIRTSDGMFFDRGEDDVVDAVERRISAWTRLPTENGEGMQVLRYAGGQKYDAHLDAFVDKFNADDAHGGQRVATVLMYLNDVDDGGETVFPETTAKPHVGDERYSACARRGVAVKPRRGDALLFWSMDETFTRVDHKSLHGGCPVGAGGVKWSMTKWIHKGAFSRGHKMKFPEGVCDDEDANCAGWAKSGECEKNPAYMTGDGRENDGHCAFSCGTCPRGSKRLDGTAAATPADAGEAPPARAAEEPEF